MPGSYNPAFTNPYQVREEDKDFLTLAANLGTDYSQLRQANPFVQSLSTGQYINVPKAPGLSAPLGPTPAANINQYGGTGSTPYGPQAPQTSRLGAPYGPGYRSQPSFSPVPSGITGRGMGIDPKLYSLYKDLAKQIEAGTPPTNIPASNLALLGTTSQKLTAAGYVFDAKTNSYKAPGAVSGLPTVSDPLAGSPGHYYVDETTAPLVGTVITRADGTHRRLLMDKNGRLFYGKIGASRRGKEARRRRAAAAAAAATGGDITGNMTTALSVVLGS